MAIATRKDEDKTDNHVETKYPRRIWLRRWRNWQDQEDNNPSIDNNIVINIHNHPSLRSYTLVSYSFRTILCILIATTAITLSAITLIIFTTMYRWLYTLVILLGPFNILYYTDLLGHYTFGFHSVIEPVVVYCVSRPLFTARCHHYRISKLKRHGRVMYLYRRQSRRECSE